MLILGPTGSGKSATVNAMLLHALAGHRPRVFIIDGGGSFDLFGASASGSPPIRWPSSPGTT